MPHFIGVIEMTHDAVDEATSSPEAMASTQVEFLGQETQPAKTIDLPKETAQGSNHALNLLSQGGVEAKGQTGIITQEQSGGLTDGEGKDILVLALACGTTDVIQIAIVEHLSRPVTLPFRALHSLMVWLQSTLEQACFAYGQKRMLSVLDERGWNAAERVQLCSWAVYFQTCIEDFKTEVKKEEIHSLLQSMIDIRNVAVERTQITAVKVKELFLAGQRMTSVLQERAYSEKIEDVLLKAEKSWTTMESEAEKLLTLTEQEVGRLRRERAKLKHQERAVVRDALMKHIVYEA
jgi:hypothetical protein